jgi:hypothetical protein
MNEETVNLKNRLVWVDPDELTKLLNAFEDLLANYGRHDGPCAPADIDNPDDYCVIHRESFSKREVAAVEMLKAFRPEFQGACIPVTRVL